MNFASRFNGKWQKKMPITVISTWQEEASLIDQVDEQNFLARADFLASHGLPALIFNMQAAAAEVLKRWVYCWAVDL